MEVTLTIQERLNDLRKERHLTLEDLAKETGISSSALGTYETEYKDISHKAITKLAKYYGVTSDFILGITENRNPVNVDIDDLHLNDEMIAFLKDGKYNNRLLSELILHPDFPKLLADIEIYVDDIAAMQIDYLNTAVDVVRQETINKYHPDESDITIKTLKAAHIDKTEYFYHRISEDLNPIIEDIRNAHKKKETTDPVNSRAEDIKRELKEVSEFTGSDQERQARFFLMQLGINYDSLYPDEFVTLINVLKKSKMLKSPLNKRGKYKTRKNTNYFVYK